MVTKSIPPLSHQAPKGTAPNVVCNLWPVADESTQTPVSAFWANLHGAQSAEDALQEAQKVLTQQEAKRHPSCRAGFMPVRGPE